MTSKAKIEQLRYYHCVSCCGQFTPSELSPNGYCWRCDEDREFNEMEARREEEENV